MMLVKGGTSENIALVPADQISVAYLPGLVSPVRITCVLSGDKKPQRKQLYFKDSCLGVFNQEKMIYGGYFWGLLADVLSNAEQATPEYFTTISAYFYQRQRQSRQRGGVRTVTVTSELQLGQKQYRQASAYAHFFE